MPLPCSWEVIFKALECPVLPEKSVCIPQTLDHTKEPSGAHNMIHAGGLGPPCTNSLTSEGTDISHMNGKPVPCDQLSVKSLDTKSQVSAPG